MRDRAVPLRAHLEELRRRLIICVLTLVATTVLSFVFYQRIVDVLLWPAPALTETPGRLVFIEVTEMFAVAMKVALVVGFAAAFPVILFQAVMFVAPALSARERRFLFAFTPAVLLAFVSGVVFGYFVLIPPAINFLVNFGSDIAIPMIRISNYVNVVVMLLFWIGVSFETPVVMFLLAKLGVVSPRAFARFRRYWFVVAFILGAIITPTFDPVNQTLVAAPLIVLYEIGIWGARLAARGRARARPAIMGATST